MKRISLNYELYKYLFLIALFISPLFLKAQNITIKGKVVDKSHNPVIGATIFLEKHKEFGVLSDTDGLFCLKIPVKYLQDSLAVRGIDIIDKKILISQLLSKKDIEVYVEENIIPEVPVFIGCVVSMKHQCFWKKIKEKVKL